MRVPDAAPSHCDSLCESSAPVTPPSQRALFISDYSTRRRLRDCTPGWACNLADCPSCGERAALRAQQDALAKFANYPWCLSIRLSVDLHRDLHRGHDDLARVRTSFLKLARLSRTTLAYLRSTEVTRPDARWNWHDHWVIIPIGSRDDERRRLLGLWDEACRQHGVTPSSHAQQSTTESALEYVLKPREGSGDGSLRDVLARAARGDADAAEDWIEWDSWRQANPHTRFRYSWVKPTETAQPVVERMARDQRIVGVSDPDLARMGLLTALGVTSKRAQASVLGVAESTISRRRRHLPPPKPGLIPFRVSA